MPYKHSLSLSPAEMRALGYRVVDLIVDHVTNLPDKPVTRKASRPTMEALLREPMPEKGAGPLEVLAQAEQDVFAHIMHLDHPRFFAFVPSPSSFVGAMADALASGYNVFAGTWLESSGPAQVELVTVDWLRQACGLPAAGGGLFVSGGSVANLTALAVARHVRLEGRTAGAMVYYSDQTHSSIARDLRILGFGADQLRTLPSDGDFRLRVGELRRAVKADRAASRIPFCIVANAGTTNTGAVDPLPDLADFCQQERLWLHVDGAYGASAVLSDRGRLLLHGLGRSDSLVLDPHKWLFQPYEMGCVLVREQRWLKDTFHILAEYLEDTEGAEEEVNYCDRGIQLTRGFRALKLWMSLKVFGREGFCAAIHRGFELAELAQATVGELPDWEVVTSAQLGIVTFRCAPVGRSAEELNRLNRNLVEAMIADGYAMISSTVLHGQTVLRLCTINPRTTNAEVRSTIHRLDALRKELPAA